MDSETRVPAVTAMMIVAAIILLVGGFLALCALLGIPDAWAGFLFSLCWGLIEKLDPEALPRTVVGSLVGLGVASLLVFLPTTLGMVWGSVIAVSITLVMIYLQVRGQAFLAVNASTMVFLTVATVPHIQAHAKPSNVLFALLLGVAYFGALGWLVIAAGKRKAAASATV